MQILLLGAGRPAGGVEPASLKKIAFNIKVLDWQMQSFSCLSAARIHFLGGYHVEEVIKNYPNLSYTIIPDWQQHSILHTLLQSPFSNTPALVTYSDTVFRRGFIEKLSQTDADIAFGVDVNFKRRYASRSKVDIDKAETVRLEKFGLPRGVAEFTGLIYFKPIVIECLQGLDEQLVGTTLIDLLNYLQIKGFRLQAIDVGHEWAELNSPSDIARFILGTKAQTLARLKPLVHHSHIGDQVTFTPQQWLSTPTTLVTLIQQTFNNKSLIVRSSSKGEDNWSSSKAGSFISHLDINSTSVDALTSAIESVVHSYGDHIDYLEDQVLIQECINNVQIAGVVFTCGLETGSPYYRFNFDDKTHSTESVTSGTGIDLRTIILHRAHPDRLEMVEPKLLPVLNAVKELEALLHFEKLDIEFAVDGPGVVHIFQVRPITVDHSRFEVAEGVISSKLTINLKRFRTLQKSTLPVLGQRTFFGNMTDWNPAEIIGTRPKPLAFSLYRQLITNDIWATQRAEFGYRDIRPHPLLVAFSGQPYVDIRASFNSFIPADLPNKIAERLIDAYLKILEDHPELHDKIEFDIAFTIWTPTFECEAKKRLMPYGLSERDITTLGATLKSITCRAITRLEEDIASVQTLTGRRQNLESSDLELIDQLFILLHDCHHYGTIAFSHAARAGFVATTLLKSFVSAGILSNERKLAFMEHIPGITRRFKVDRQATVKGDLTQAHLIEQYGHLRPGTYDVNAEAYWENPELYLYCNDATEPIPTSTFRFSDRECKDMAAVLQSMGASVRLKTFIQYLGQAIQARERVKFEFTRNLSKALDMCILLGKTMGLSREQIAYLEYHDFKLFKLNIIDIEMLKDRIIRNQQMHRVTCLSELPTLITRESDFYCFERQTSQPNFVTTKKTASRVKILQGNSYSSEDIDGKIIMISQADPGYDWLFGHNIAGLITKYGGANSHMAIRAAEMGLPAAIGIGEKLYEAISKARKVELDCANEIIRLIA